MIFSQKAKLLTAVMLVSIAPTNAQPYGRSDGAPRDMVESSPQTGGYCDRSGCPNQFWKYRIFYGPVYYHGRWFRGPVYVKDDYGRNLFWVAGGWHRDEWHAIRPRWARNAYFGPPQSRDYYRTNDFGGRGRYSDSSGQPRDWRDARENRDAQAPDGRQGYADNRRYGSDSAPVRNDAYGQDRQNGGQDRRQYQDQYQGAGANGQDQRSQYGYGQGSGQGGDRNDANRQANGGPQNFTNRDPRFGQNIPGGRTSGQNVAQAQPQTTTISVTMATYGGRTCKIPNGNVTQPLQTACNGKATCQYTVNHLVIGDPAPGCAKDFVVEWTCGTSPGGSASLPGEASGGKVNLSCPAGTR